MSDERPAIQRHGGKITAAALVAASLAVAPLIGQFEGKRNVGYFDIVGVPTFCFGGTGPAAVVGKRYTDAECNTQRATMIRAHAEGIARCITVAVPSPSLQAFISFSFNVGVGGFCKSNVARKLNAGDLRGACAGLSAWDYAGGKRIHGLTVRRAQERTLCERGL